MYITKISEYNDIIDIISKQLKQRKDALDEFTVGVRYSF